MTDGYLIPILQRPKRVDCASWAELNRFMPSTHTMFSFIQTPFFREPTRYLSDLAGTSRVILCTPAQVGKTTAIENFLGWIATYDRARYDSNIRVLQTITNRFQQKYRFDVDEPMTLTMRNDIIHEENDYLAYLKSVGAIIGDASCQFLADDNPQDNVALGQFVWSIAATITPPMKYAQLNVGFTSAGYSVYYEA